MEEIISKLMDILSNPQVIMIGGFAIEMILRFSKTEKPKSIIRVIAKIARLVGTALIAVADYSDKVLPQRLK